MLGPVPRGSAVNRAGPLPRADKAMMAVVAGPLRADEAVEVLHAHWRPLHGLAMSVLRDVHAAQDAVQDAIVAIIRLEPTFTDEAAALRYARTTVLNNCRSMLRRTATARDHLRLVGREGVAAPADEPLLRTESTRRVLHLFDRLPVRQREVLTLRYLHHLTDQEISTLLEVSHSAVRTAASRALATLSRRLEGST